MTRVKLGLLDLCVVVFGLIAFNTAAAQAEVGAQWLFAEKIGGTKLVPFLEATVQLEKETTAILHSKISGLSVLFECNTISTVNAKLKANGSIGEGARIKFTNCITKLNGATSAPCEPVAGGTEKGVINTNAGHGLITLAILKDKEGKVIGKDNVLSFLPDTGETYVTLEMSKECAIGTKIPVIGKLFLKDCEGLISTHLVRHLVEVASKAEGTELFVISKTLEHEATILGSSWAFLTGAHEGLKFSGDPA